jgi:hypothetical protein
MRSSRCHKALSESRVPDNGPPGLTRAGAVRTLAPPLLYPLLPLALRCLPSRSNSTPNSVGILLPMLGNVFAVIFGNEPIS